MEEAWPPEGEPRVFSPDYNNLRVSFKPAAMVSATC